MASPEFVTGGAAIPPRAPALDVVVEAAVDDMVVVVEFENGTERTAMFVDVGGSTTTVLVTIEQSDPVVVADVMTAAGVATGGSISIVLVTIVQDSVAGVKTTAGVALTLAPTALSVEDFEIVATVDKTEPATVAVAGTVTVAVILAALLAVALAVLAALEQDVF